MISNISMAGPATFAFREVWLPIPLRNEFLGKREKVVTQSVRTEYSLQGGATLQINGVK